MLELFRWYSLFSAYLVTIICSSPDNLMEIKSLSWWGFFVQLQSAPFPDTEESTKQANTFSKHLPSFVDATCLAPYITIVSEYPSDGC